MTDREKFPPLGQEFRFARKLNMPDLFVGVTTAEQRRDRIRKEIISRGLADEPIQRRMGVVETYREAFQRQFGQPLQPGESTC